MTDIVLLKDMLKRKEKENKRPIGPKRPSGFIRNHFNPWYASVDYCGIHM